MGIILDLIRAGFGWVDIWRSDRQIIRQVTHEQRMNDIVEHSVTNPLQFHKLLEGLGREDLSDLHRRLDRRVQSWGACFSDKHHRSLNTLILLRNETGDLLTTAQRW